MKQWVCAAMLAGLTMGSASAAPVTRSFNVTATSFANFFGEPAPFKTLSADITLTYDTSSSGFYGAPDYFRVVTDGQVNAGPLLRNAHSRLFPAKWHQQYGTRRYWRRHQRGECNAGKQ